MTTIDTDSTTDRTNALTEVRRVFASGRTRAPQWRVQQLRAIEQMCDDNMWVLKFDVQFSFQMSTRCPIGHLIETSSVSSRCFRLDSAAI